MEFRFASRLTPGFAAGCAAGTVPAPGRGFGDSERGTRLLAGAMAVLDFVIRVLCGFLVNVALLREGNPGLGGGPPKKEPS